ncbi:MAG: hypothetical protein AABX07_03495 [Nanoarchaeota archaeon]
MLDLLNEDHEKRLILSVGNEIAPEKLERACVQAGESLGYEPQVHKNNGSFKKDITITLNIPYASYPFQIGISRKSERTNRIEVWTGRVYNEVVLSRVLQYGSRVAEFAEKQEDSL